MNEELNALHDIRKMMERSSRFISLSGWSGISAGICALIGAYAAHNLIVLSDSHLSEGISDERLKINLGIVAGLTFVFALFFAFYFSYRKSKSQQISIWGTVSKRLMWSIALPLIAGGALILKLVDLNIPGLIAPSCLLFYGIALYSGSKLTLDEIRYLAYSEILLGIISLFFTGYGLYFWAFGFGFLHILYGVVMWLKYDRKK